MTPHKFIQSIGQTIQHHNSLGLFDNLKSPALKIEAKHHVFCSSFFNLNKLSHLRLLLIEATCKACKTCR